MATRRKLKDLSPWPALLLEGQLLTASTVQKVVDQDADHQLPTDYGLHKNMNLRNEIDIRFRLGQTRYQAFVGSKNTQADSVTIGLGETKRFVTDLLHETLSFDDLSPGEIPLAAIAGQGRIPVVVCDPQHKLDERTDALSTTRSQSANTALQDYLNDQEEALWGIACNGHTLRLMRDNESLTRPAYVEFNLQHIFENEDVSSFAALWMLLHRSRFGVADAPVTDCSLERWKEQGTKDGEAIRDDLAKQVTEALKALGSGFLNDNASLRENLTSQGEIDLVDFFNELLRLVYRLIFLMVAEDRNLLHHPNKSTQVARKLYADGYGTQQLREISLQRDARDKYSDRYEALKIVLEALSETDATRRDILGLPALGGLFGAGRSPILEGLVLSNEALLRAVYKLGYFKRDEATTAVNWGQMETEELGSVYESLLELQPQLGPFGKTLQFANEVAEKKGNQRKTTGSYYTPDSLVQALLDTALDPVLERIEKEANSETEAAERMLALTVIDPACGSGHFLLAAARRMATRIARLRHEGTPSLADYRHALREVARGCLYGVDRNPMAVELAQVALWIETIDPGYPLGFFDAQIRCGDSLLGVFDLEVLEDGIPDGAYKALTGDDKEIAKYYKNVNKKYRDNKATEFDFAGGDIGVGLSAKPVVKSFASMFRMPEEELWQVRKKAARYVELRESEEFQKLYHSADLYIGAFLTPKVGEQPTGASAHTIPTTIELYQALAGNPLPQNLSQAVAASRKARAFHWPLEFPHVMEAGGFDVVLGNPPWDLLKIEPSQDKAYFSKIQNFFKLGQFDILNGRRDLYKLFLAILPKLLRKGAEAGLIIPVGWVLEQDSEDLRAMLRKVGSIRKIAYIQNSGKSIFKSVDSRYLFVLLNYSGRIGQTPSVSALIKGDLELRKNVSYYGHNSEGGDTNEIIGIHPSRTDYKGWIDLKHQIAEQNTMRFYLTAEWHASSDKAYAIDCSNDDAIAVGKNSNIHQYNDWYERPSFCVKDSEAKIKSSNKTPMLIGTNARILVRDIVRSDDTVSLIACLTKRKLSSYDTPAVCIRGGESVISRLHGKFLVAYLNSSIGTYMVRPFLDKHLKGYVLAHVPVPNFIATDSHLLVIADKVVEIERLAADREEPVWKTNSGKQLLIDIDELLFEYFSISELTRDLVRSGTHLYS
jgi:type I restriction-modification system DNA methylase subunit